MKPGSSVCYIAPFAVFLLFLLVRDVVPGGPGLEYPLRVVTVAAVFWVCSRHLMRWRLSRPAGSVVLGLAVAGIWIAPDLLWPAYREQWLFDNRLTGRAESSIPEALHGDPLFLCFRVAGTALLVPLIEELFWRGWLMRYLVSPDFESIRPGAFSGVSFWVTAVLFASEHGPYWDVGLAAGILYNAWMVRTGNLADCVLTHGVTNACLAAYVLGSGRWQYWL